MTPAAPQTSPRTTVQRKSTVHEIASTNSTSNLFLGNSSKRSWMVPNASTNEPSTAAQSSLPTKSPVKSNAGIRRSSTGLSPSRIRVTRDDWSSSSDDEVVHQQAVSTDVVSVASENGDVLHHTPTPPAIERQPIPSPLATTSLSSTAVEAGPPQGTAGQPDLVETGGNARTISNCDISSTVFPTGSTASPASGVEQGDLPRESSLFDTQEHDTTAPTNILPRTTESVIMSSSIDVDGFTLPSQHGHPVNQSPRVLLPNPSQQQVLNPSASGSETNIAAPSAVSQPPPHLHRAHRLRYQAQAIRQHIGQNDLDKKRIEFLLDACENNDMDAVLMHQIFMVSTHLPNWLVQQLGFQQLDGFPILAFALGSNDGLTPDLSRSLLNFPDNCSVLLYPGFRKPVEQVRRSLELLTSQWPLLHQQCTVRGFLPSPQEICEGLSLPSPKLQRLIFTALGESTGISQSTTIGREIVQRFINLQAARRNAQATVAVDVQQWRRLFHLPRGSTMITDQRLLGAVRLAPPPGYVPMPARTFNPSQLQNQGPRPPVNGSARATNRGMQQYGPLAPQVSVMNSTHGPVRHARRPHAQMPPTVQGIAQTGNRRATQPTRQPGVGSFRVNEPAGRSRIANRPLRIPVNQQPLGAPVQVQQSQPLLPSSDHCMAMAVRPNSDRIALHQAHLRAPLPHIVDADGADAPNLRLFQVVRKLCIAPQLLSLNKRYMELSFEVAESDLQQGVQYVENSYTPMLRGFHVYKPGTLSWRLRCIALNPTSTTPPTEDEFSAKSTDWPEHLFSTLNATLDIEPLRKQHYGKCLPAELSHAIVSGTNNLILAYDETPNVKSIYKKQHWIAIELVECIPHATLRASIPFVDSPTSLARITTSMQPSGHDDDDDITITNPTISITLTDPFTALIWRVPTRGKTCKHRECFDLDTFIDTRPLANGFAEGPRSADEWKCPICGRDARPGSLVVDGFLVGVRQWLEKEGRLEGVKSVVVKEDGGWEVRWEGEISGGGGNDNGSGVVECGKGKDGEQQQQQQQQRARTESVPAREVDAVMLDDDDDDDDHN